MLLRNTDIKPNTNPPNGAICDICGKRMAPLTYVKLAGIMTCPGRKYPDVSSDLTTKTLDKRHLCPKCYEELLEYIDSHSKEEIEE